MRLATLVKRLPPLPFLLGLLVLLAVSACGPGARTPPPEGDATAAAAADAGATTRTPTPTPGTDAPAPIFYQEAVWSPDGATLLLSRYEGGGYSIYSVRADGSHLERLIDGPGYWTSWSPDGARFAYHAEPAVGAPGGDIFVADADGSNPIALTNLPSKELTPAWSPDGATIAFISDRDDGRYQLFLMNPDGSNQTRIGRTGGTEYNPTWSPDSEWLAFFSSVNDTDWVYVTRRDAAESRRVARGVFPSWSPDGASILYDRADSIFATTPDGAAEVLLIVDGFAGRWSPDGRRIAFIRGGWPSSDVYVANSDGSAEARLTR